MPVSRCFLGWDEPLTNAVCGFLLPDVPGLPVVLDRTLLVLPTRGAMRRVRTGLTARCDGLFPPVVRLPAALLDSPGERRASPAMVKAAWCQALRRTDLSRLQALFPTPPPDPGFAWALHTGGLIQRLRDQLADGGTMIRDLLHLHAGEMPEAERWQNLASLEEQYLDAVQQSEFADPSLALIQAARCPRLPAGIERVVVAGVPDLAPVVSQALARLAESIEVCILVHAPESEANTFDDYGRPLPEAWAHRPIEPGTATFDLHLASDEYGQADRVVALLAEPGDRHSVTLGVPDRRVIAPLADALARMGRSAFDPGGVPFTGHPLYLLLSRWRDMVALGDYRSLSRFLRHPDVLSALTRRDVRPHALLAQLDQLQNRHLPAEMDDVLRAIEEDEAYAGKTGREAAYSDLAPACNAVRTWYQAAHNGPGVDALHGLLQEIYSDSLAYDATGAADFAAGAEIVVSVLEDLATVDDSAFHADPSASLSLLLRCLEEKELFPHRGEEEVVLEGWMEMPWSGSAWLVLTGMNEGVVPSGQCSDLFLPDRLRERLGLRHDAERLARDAFLFAGMIASRREGGRVTCILGKTARSGDPLKPSRLLLQCDDETLPDRAAQLFAEVPASRANVLPSVSFRLDAGLSRDAFPSAVPAQLDVTAFREYLACPFRFYLGRVLGMREMDDEKSELDALDFGTLVHYALEQMGKETSLRACADADVLAAFLKEAAERYALGRFGSQPTLQVQIQLRSATERLRRMAEIQASEVKQGWEIVEVERRVTGDLDFFDGIPIVGKIDRIDRHRDTGAWRVLDYKTSETSEVPLASHVGRRDDAARPYANLMVDDKPRTWINLQLPLYRILLSLDEDDMDSVEMGFFNLPKSAQESGIAVWQGLDAVMERAEHCVRGMISDIRDCRYWPASERVQYDDFARLFPVAVEECVDEVAFEKFMQEAKSTGL
jgi:ATP-dependent helicase/nuclease subunit B